MPIKIFLFNSYSLFALKGNIPVNNLYKIIPHAQISTLLSYYIYFISSGAIYDRVPQDVFYNSIDLIA